MCLVMHPLLRHHPQVELTNRILDISTTWYVKKQQQKYKHSPPKWQQHCPYTPDPRKYGPAAQDPMPIDESPEATPRQKVCTQQIVDSFLHYARAMDPTIHTALNDLANQQSKPTNQTIQRVKHFLEYMTTHPNVVIWYYASEIASYLTVPKDCSCASRHYYLGSILQGNKPVYLNGIIHILSKILNCVAALVTEAELNAFFLTKSCTWYLPNSDTCNPLPQSISTTQWQWAFATIQ